MKKLKLLPFRIIAILAIIFASCSKPVAENLPGTWNLNMTETYFGLEGNKTGTATFKEDGTGTWTINDETDEITWSSINENIKIASEGETPITLEVITNKNDEQEWIGTMTESEDGYTITTELTIKLTK